MSDQERKTSIDGLYCENCSDSDGVCLDCHERFDILTKKVATLRGALEEIKELQCSLSPTYRHATAAICIKALEATK